METTNQSFTHVKFVWIKKEQHEFMSDVWTWRAIITIPKRFDKGQYISLSLPLTIETYWYCIILLVVWYMNFQNLQQQQTY